MVYDDREQLLNDAIDTAIHFLKKSAEFYPFATVIVKDGSFRHIQMLSSESTPQSGEVLESLEKSLKDSAILDEYRAVAIVCDMRLRGKNGDVESDVISIDIDSRTSSPIKCFIPYEIVSGDIVLGEPRYGSGERIVFG